MKHLILIIGLGSLLALNSCVPMYLAGVAAEHHANTKSKQDCETQGGKWSGGSSWTFDGGKCIYAQVSPQPSTQSPDGGKRN